MSTESLSTFQSALTGLDVEYTETTTDAFSETLTEIVEEPAVGAPLVGYDVSLDDVPVTCGPSTGELTEAATGVTGVDKAVAEHGSLLLPSDEGGTEPVSLYPPTHVAVVQASDVLPDVKAATEWLDGEFTAGRRSTVFATGVSATGDMGALVEGVHGPANVHVVVITDQ
ncbi:LUD domain-containing protein [Halospeciosus flavus]|uniref:LUD domain-containing protein n=1 Tax=Halospeciosus flavus TaxID=3032283 RepID=A0ABD5Z0X1_9EURY|nr:LUD domain-containing protein [Halospeciosus flavus]